MKLLIITQKVDKNDPILGFFHRWIEEFAKHCEKLTVICLGKGEYDLPEKIKVLSLGKEEGVGRLEYLKRFYTYIREEKDNYDSVFVHMNQEYVLLGAIPWKTWGKKMFMWRNHPKGSFLTDIAVWLSDKVFCTSEFSYTAKFPKTELMPVGIDTEFFKRDKAIKKRKNSILFLGRISPIKRPHIFIEALEILNKNGIDFSATIVGDALPTDSAYFDGLKKRVDSAGLNDRVKFSKAVKNSETKELYNEHEIYVNLTPSGSMDKTIFEAMACESLVLVSNKSLFGKIGDIFISGEKPDKIAKSLGLLINLSGDEKNNYGNELRDHIILGHGLKKLVNKFSKIAE